MKWGITADLRYSTERHCHPEAASAVEGSGDSSAASRPPQNDEECSGRTQNDGGFFGWTWNGGECTGRTWNGGELFGWTENDGEVVRVGLE